MTLSLPDSRWSQLSDFIAGAIGLHFTPERRPDLQRGLAGAAEEFGFEDVAECADWLLSTPPTRAQLQVLASHLTIGETYFFRDRQTFEVLAEHVLPGLIQSRRGREQRLRVWSAGCCTGEETYSLAILLRQALPDLADWSVTILATDINPHFLRKAVAGSYGEWSFRDRPASFKARYFTRVADGRYVVAPEIKAMVRFAPQNLVEDAYPALATDSNAMDLIFCRNVMMYFTPAQTRKVIGKLHRALVEDGWLAVSPSETSQTLFSEFATRNFPGVTLYQKSDAQAPDSPRPSRTPPDEAAPWFRSALEAPLPSMAQSTAAGEAATARPPDRPVLPQAPSAPHALAASLYQQGRYGEAADMLLALGEQHRLEPPAFSLLARALANQGRLDEAFGWCERWIAADKLDTGAHYLRAMVLLEQGDPGEARRSLQRALYLHPAFVLAHFALGNLARSQGNNGAADKHFRNALDLLARCQPDDPLPESDGLTAGRLSETITTLTTLVHTHSEQ